MHAAIRYGQEKVVDFLIETSKVIFSVEYEVSSNITLLH